MEFIALLYKWLPSKVTLLSLVLIVYFIDNNFLVKESYT